MSFLDYYLLGTPQKKKLVLKGEKAVEEFECITVSRPLTKEEQERREREKKGEFLALLIPLILFFILILFSLAAGSSR